MVASPSQNCILKTNHVTDPFRTFRRKVSVSYRVYGKSILSTIKQVDTLVVIKLIKRYIIYYTLS